MSLVNLAEEIYRRKNKAPVEKKETYNMQSKDEEDILFLVTQEILQDYADVVQAVSVGAKEPAILERLAARIITERGYVLQGGYQGTIKGILDHILRYGSLQELIDDPKVTDIFVNGPQNVYKRVNNRDIF